MEQLILLLQYVVIGIRCFNGIGITCHWNWVVSCSLKWPGRRLNVCVDFEDEHHQRLPWKEQGEEACCGLVSLRTELLDQSGWTQPPTTLSWRRSCILARWHIAVTCKDSGIHASQRFFPLYQHPSISILLRHRSWNFDGVARSQPYRKLLVHH